MSDRMAAVYIERLADLLKGEMETLKSVVGSETRKGAMGGTVTVYPDLKGLVQLEMSIREDAIILKQSGEESKV